MRLATAALLFIATVLPAKADPVPFGQPAVNTPLVGCVEGRALRIVNGQPSCASTAPPTLTACTGGTIDASATDFIGQITIPAGLSSCTVVMTQLYSTTFVCLTQQQSGASLSLGVPTVGNNGVKSTLVIPFGLTLSTTKFGYFCGPG